MPVFAQSSAQLSALDCEQRTIHYGTPLHNIHSRRCQHRPLIFKALIILRVVELNIGIICGCMPVIFVFFKKASKNDTYQAFMKRFRTSLPRSSKEQPGLPTGSGADARRIRLAIPKPIITGLRSLIHKMHHNEHSPPVESIATESYNDLDSGPYDYHKQLRAMEMNSSQ